jgi:hypothetical protein
VYVRVPAAFFGFDFRTVMQEAQFLSRRVRLHDPDGNPLTIGY